MDYLLTDEESQKLYFRKVQPSDFELWLPFHEDQSSTPYWLQNSHNLSRQKWNAIG